MCFFCPLLSKLTIHFGKVKLKLLCGQVKLLTDLGFRTSSTTCTVIIRGPNQFQDFLAIIGKGGRHFFKIKSHIKQLDLGRCLRVLFKLLLPHINQYAVEVCEHVAEATILTLNDIGPVELSQILEHTCVHL